MDKNNHKLKRVLGLPLLTLYGLGTILGAGIYVLIGKVAGTAGLYAPISFLVAASIAALTGLSYAQLAVRFPYSAGEAIYVREAFNIKAWAAAVGYLVLLTGLVSAATMARGFAGYLLVFIDLPMSIAVIIILILIVALVCWGIAESVTVAAVVTVIELAGLFIILFLLRESLFDISVEWKQLIPPVETSAWLSIGAGAFLAFYAFIGFEDMVNVIEEVRAPKQTMPKAIMLALLFAAVLYVLVALAAVMSLPSEQLSESDSPMVTLLEQDYPQTAALMGLISLIAILNGVIVQLIMGSRLLYGMSMRQMAPRYFGHILPATRTPIRATLAIGLLVAIFALSLPLLVLAKLTSFVIVIVFILVNLSLIVIHYREGLRRVADLGLPALAVLLCVLLFFMGLQDLF